MAPLAGYLKEVQGLPIMSYTLLIRAKLEAFYLHRSHSDGEDLVFLLSDSASGCVLDASLLFGDEAAYFIKSLEGTDCSESVKRRVREALLSV